MNIHLFSCCESDELHSYGLFKSHERTTPGEYGSAQERDKEFREWVYFNWIYLISFSSKSIKDDRHIVSRSKGLILRCIDPKRRITRRRHLFLIGCFDLL